MTRIFSALAIAFFAAALLLLGVIAPGETADRQFDLMTYAMIAVIAGCVFALLGIITQQEDEA